jgi:hypothetical protein
VWPEHRLYAVGPVLAALEDAGIAVHARSVRYRALLQFLGPYVPVEILVPPNAAADARRIIEGRLLQDQGAKEDVARRDEAIPAAVVNA